MKNQHTIQSAKEFLSELTKKVINSIRIYLSDSYAILRMRISVYATKAVHRNIIKNEKYNEQNNKNIRQYIVLLELPDKKRKKKTERLWWINRRNFKKVKRLGWLPDTMHLDDLRGKAFYYTDMKRSYAEEYYAKKKAINKYVFYLREKHGLSS